jgi:hypothetical protein
LVLLALALGVVPQLVMAALLQFGIGSWRDALLGFYFALVLFVPMALIATLVALIPRWRAGAVRAAVLSATLAAALFVGNVVSMKARMFAFDRAGERAQPLVDAVARFEEENGAPPNSIDELIPRWLPEVPAGIPPLRILSSPQSDWYAGNSWMLEAQTPIIFLNWDTFIYLPKQNYSDVRGFRFTLLGRWAYVHE